MKKNWIYIFKCLIVFITLFVIDDFNLKNKVTLIQYKFDSSIISSIKYSIIRIDENYSIDQQIFEAKVIQGLSKNLKEFNLKEYQLQLSYIKGESNKYILGVDLCFQYEINLRQKIIKKKYFYHHITSVI